MSQYTRTQLENMLSRGIVQISFTKKDGSDRVMNCTTNLNFIPKNKHPKSQNTRSDDVIAVYDVESNDWRSFDIKSVYDVS